MEQNILILFPTILKGKDCYFFIWDPELGAPVSLIKRILLDKILNLIYNMCYT